MSKLILLIVRLLLINRFPILVALDLCSSYVDLRGLPNFTSAGRGGAGLKLEYFGISKAEMQFGGGVVALSAGERRCREKRRP